MRSDVRNTVLKQKYPALFEILADVHENLGKFKDALNAAKVLKTPLRGCDYCVLTAISEIEISSISIGYLSAEGHIHDCFTILRRMQEYYHELEYLKTDPDKLGQQWLDYDYVKDISQYRYYRDAGGAASEEIRSAAVRLYADHTAELDFFTRSHAGDPDPLNRTYHLNWTKLNRRDLAIKAGLEEDYFAYAHFSTYVHPSISHALKHIRIKDDTVESVGPVLGPDNGEMQNLFFSTCHILLCATEFASEFYGVNLPGEHEGLRERWKGIRMEGQ